MIEYIVSGEFKFFADSDSSTNEYEPYGYFVIECEDNRDEVVWNRTRKEHLVIPINTYWTVAFHYPISTTESGKLVYHGSVMETDGYAGDLIGSYEGHTVKVTDIIGKENVQVFPGSRGLHKVVISIKLTEQ